MLEFLRLLARRAFAVLRGGVANFCAAMGLGGAKVNDDINEIWHYGDAALKKRFQSDDIGIFNAPLQVTPSHLALLRKARFRWNGAEIGAPMLDPDAPYTRTDLMKQIAEAFPGESPEDLAMRHVEITVALRIFLARGKISPGDYQIKNLPLDVLRQDMSGYGADGGLTDDQLSLLPDGQFRLTDEHITLARGMPVEWSNEYDNEERLDFEQYPAAAFDPKRPYGDFSWFQVDMARLLNLLPPRNSDGAPGELPQELEERLACLHWQMLGAIQVIVENAEFELGQNN